MRFVMISCTTLVCALMTGCATEVISSSERTVVVQARVRDIAQAQALADTECKKRGTLARFSGKATPNQFVFDCVN